MTAFDPYEQWLEIPPEEQPADYYRLLGLARFEGDLGRITAAADERMARVRSYQTGPRGAHTQKILNELATARVRLLDPASKAEYDRELAQVLAKLEAARRGQAARPIPEPPPVTAPSVPPPAPPLARPTNRPYSLVVGWSIAAVVLAISAWAISRSMSRTEKSVVRAASTAKKERKATSRAPLEPPAVAADTGGALVCRPPDAMVTGDVGIVTGGNGDALGGWDTVDGEAQWELYVERPGFYQAEVTYAATAAAEDSALLVRIGDRTRSLSLRPSGGLDSFHVDTVTVAIERSGRQTLALRPQKAHAGEWLLVQSVRLVPMAANVRP